MKVKKLAKSLAGTQLEQMVISMSQYVTAMLAVNPEHYADNEDLRNLLIIEKSLIQETMGYSLKFTELAYSYYSYGKKVGYNRALEEAKQLNLKESDKK